MKDIAPNDIKNNIPLVTRKNYTREIVAGSVRIGDGELAIMAGPCTVESRTQIFETAKGSIIPSALT